MTGNFNENNKESMDNKEIAKILEWHNSGTLKTDEAVEKIFSLFGVVGQSEQLVCDECGDTGRSYPTLQYPDGVDCEKCKAN